MRHRHHKDRGRENCPWERQKIKAAYEQLLKLSNLDENEMLHLKHLARELGKTDAQMEADRSAMTVSTV
jgi:hypothetical protein